jgi:hypothetical protein
MAPVTAPVVAPAATPFWAWAAGDKEISVATATPVRNLTFIGSFLSWVLITIPGF